MWQNTRLLNALADGMFALAAVVVAKLVVIACLNASWLPVRTVRITGELARISPDQLAEALTGRPMKNFFAVDVEEVRARLQAVPWVRRVTVRRAWPDRLDVLVEPQQAVARWSDGRLVNAYGELFSAASSEPLLELGGPEGTEKEVSQRAADYRRLLSAIGMQLHAVSLSDRLAWEVSTTEGTTIVLGRDMGCDAEPHCAEHRLQRFVAFYGSAVAPLGASVQRIDLRYPNGFAVRIPNAQSVVTGDAATAAVRRAPPPSSRPAPRRAKGPGRAA